jgi:hypothetical protein
MNKKTNLDNLKKQIDRMDVKSEEFAELYWHIADKYHTFENPDEYQVCISMLYQWMNRSPNNHEDQVIIIAKLVKELFMMRLEKKTACTGTIKFTDETFFFDIYTTEGEKDKLRESIFKAGEAIIKESLKINKNDNKEKEQRL